MASPTAIFKKVDIFDLMVKYKLIETEEFVEDFVKIVEKEIKKPLPRPIPTPILNQLRSKTENIKSLVGEFDATNEEDVKKCRLKLKDHMIMFDIIENEESLVGRVERKRPNQEPVSREETASKIARTEPTSESGRPLRISSVLSSILAKHFGPESVPENGQPSRKAYVLVPKRGRSQTVATQAVESAQTSSSSQPNLPVVVAPPTVGPALMQLNPSVNLVPTVPIQPQMIPIQPQALPITPISQGRIVLIRPQIAAPTREPTNTPRQVPRPTPRQSRTAEYRPVIPDFEFRTRYTDYFSPSSCPTVIRLLRSRALRSDYYSAQKRQKCRVKHTIKAGLAEVSMFLSKIGLRVKRVELNPVELDECDFKLKIRSPDQLTDPDQEEPDVDNVIYFKDKFSVSDRTYEEFRQICELNAPNLYKVKKRKTEIDSAFKIYNNQMGVFYSIREKLTFRLESFFDNKYNSNEKTPIDDEAFRDQIIHVKLAADGTNIGRNLKLLNFTFTIINEGAKAKTASGNYTVGIFEIETESRTAVMDSFRELTDEIENTDKLTVRGQTVKIVFYYGGDWKMLANSLGIQGANSKYPCVWCKCPKEDFHRADLEWSICDAKKGARTHEEQAAILNHPDYDKIVNYGYKNEPIMRDIIPISRYMIDMLHLFLRISDTLFNLLVKDCCLADGFDMGAISKFDVAKYKHMNSLQHFLNEKCNVKFSFYWVAETKKLTWRDMVGPEKIRFLENMKLEEIIPDHDKFNEVETIWKEFYEIVNSVKLVEIEADELVKRTKEWVKLYLSVYKTATVTPYMHAFVSHLHEFVYLYKDINAFNCQGLEKLNDITTRQYFKGTNRGDNSLHQILKKRNRLELLTQQLTATDEN